MRSCLIFLNSLITSTLSPELAAETYTHGTHQLTIRKGYKHGVVGRIKEVHANSSIVELVSSPTFRVAARFLGDNRPITYKGSELTTFANPTGEVHNIPNDIVINPEAPLRLVSSQLGGILPRWLNNWNIKST